MKNEKPSDSNFYVFRKVSAYGEYPAGTRVELVRMDDVQAPPIGMKGTVTGVDDTASVMVAWDNGSRLHVIYGEDEVRKIKGDD